MLRRPTPARPRWRTSTLTSEERLLTVLERARAVGFLGPGPLRVHLDHARSYEAQIPAGARSLIDLGSGGGVPGLPIVADLPELSGLLLDASAKRTAFLVWAAIEVGIADRVEVITDRAERGAHRPELRMQFDVAVCRGFGPPAVTIECAAGFVADGGRLLISEPPVRRRWNNDILASIGLRHVATIDGVARFDRVGPTPQATPRTSKQMQRAPLPVELDD